MGFSPDEQHFRGRQTAQREKKRRANCANPASNKGCVEQSQACQQEDSTIRAAFCTFFYKLLIAIGRLVIVVIIAHRRLCDSLTSVVKEFLLSDGAVITDGRSYRRLASLSTRQDNGLGFRHQRHQSLDY